jgi:hypothetical protein
MTASRGVGKGGSRKGAGRKVGTVTKKSREVANRLVASGELTPLEFFLGVLRQEPTAEMSATEQVALFERRLDAAKAAAPYVHAKLANVVSNSTVQGQITLVSDFPA